MTNDMTTDFEQALERHRRELHVHCYRMLGSFDEAEDALQEALPARVAGARDAQTSDADTRAWLYKIATNVCLDALRKRQAPVPGARVQGRGPVAAAVPRPAAGRGRADARSEPDAVVVARETIELTYIALIQLLPPRQRAVVILRDVLDWSAAETAEMLDISVAAANSALQRGARRRCAPSCRDRPSERPVAADVLSEDEQRLLAGLHRRPRGRGRRGGAALMREDIRVTMPPQPMVFDGRDAIAPLLATAFGPEGMGEWRLVPTRANRMPAAASYLRKPGETEWRAFKLDILRCEGGRRSPRSRPSTRRCSSSSGLPAVLDER